MSFSEHKNNKRPRGDNEATGCQKWR